MNSDKEQIMNYNPDIFREYDIRGKYNIDYDQDFAFNLGVALHKFSVETFTNGKKIKIGVGIDARHSSKPLAESLSQGLIAMGADVLDLGLITSPVSYFANHALEDLTGAVMITGSHNPPEYNGFKITVDKKSLTSDEIKALQKNIDVILINTANTDLKKGALTKFDIKALYVKRMAEEFSHLKNIPFTIDCGNGAAGSVARDVFTACNLNPTILFEEPDGDFPNHHPDPTLEENLIQLKESIKSNGSLFGIGYDGDADRIVVVTNSGRTVYADELMALYAKSVLDKYPGAKIIADVKCSDQYYSILKDWGAEAIMWKTGHSLIKKKVIDDNSPFGGEFSGHIFFNDRFYGFDDAIYCSLRLIEIVQNSNGKSLDELLTFYPKTFSSPEIRIEVGEQEKYLLVDLFKKNIRSQCKFLNEIDGARATFENGWALVRVSNTQPAITLRFEGKTEKDLNKIMENCFSILNINIKKYI